MRPSTSWGRLSPSLHRRPTSTSSGSRRSSPARRLDAASTIGGMARAEAGVHIDRPPEEVFAFVADVTNNPSWRKNVTRAEWLDDGPMRIGRRGRQAQRVLGREWTVEAEIVEWDPPRQITWEVRQGPV